MYKENKRIILKNILIISIKENINYEKKRS